VSRMGAKRQKGKVPRDLNGFGELTVCVLTNRSSGRVEGKVPSSYSGVRAAQLNR